MIRNTKHVNQINSGLFACVGKVEFLCRKSFRTTTLNATINVPYFRHRNIFFGLLTNFAIFLGGKILKFDFLGVF